MANSRINTLPLRLATGSNQAGMSLLINPVGEAGYPRINTLPRWQLSTHKHSTQRGVFTHKHSTDAGSKLDRARNSGVPLYFSFPVCKRFTCICLRLSVESRDKAAPYHNRLGSSGNPCIHDSKSKPSGLGKRGSHALTVMGSSAINCSERGEG